MSEQISYEDRIAEFTPAKVAALSAEQAGVELARLSASYQKSQKPPPSDDPAVAASQRLAELQATPGWRDLLFSGNAQANKEFRELSAAAAGARDVDLALASFVPPGHINTGNGPGLQDQIVAVGELRAAGLDEQVIREIFDGVPADGKPYNAATVEYVRALRTQKMADASWAQRVLSGDTAARRELHLMSIVLANAA